MADFTPCDEEISVLLVITGIFLYFFISTENFGHEIATGASIRLITFC